MTWFCLGNHNQWIRALLLLPMSLTGLAGPPETAKTPDSELPPPVTTTVDFARDVKPILAARCVECHGPTRRKGGLRLDRRPEALAGGVSGPVIEPGRGAESLLIHNVASFKEATPMPPRGDRLTTNQIALLRGWIDQGAVWPEGLVVEPLAPVPNTSNTSSPIEQHWAFQPIRRVSPPAMNTGREALGNGAIDAFVLDRLSYESITPAPEADRATLARRLSLDLLGLPPRPDWLDAFLRDQSPDAYERLVDTLLASPHFGERWGRHWLDLARYADSDGYEKDLPRPFAWRYRDWVIRAINRDLPFDQFTIEQLAGDLLPSADLDQRIATGFHRNTLTNREGGVDQEEYRVAAVIDRVNTTASVWLGLTVGCAQCHSHKYDPIEQREYYSLFAFFNNADEFDLAAPLPGEPATAGPPPATQGKNEDQAKNKPREPAVSRAPILSERVQRRATHLLIRGDFLRPGAVVQPAALEVLHPTRFPSDRPADRLDLARWLVDPANPLTARVTANRLWKHLFGRGLVASLDDFGTRGERPSHPQLLDWLAAELIRQNWSTKALIRTIVLSSTYRRSSASRPELLERDPYNVLLARQSRFRLDAEVIRDQALAASGLLYPIIGGPSFRPPLPDDLAALGYAGSVKWTESTGPQRDRRGLYIFFQRTVPYPMLTTFDAPDSNVSCARRERSNTPLQALTLWNDPVFVECARGLARRLLLESAHSAELADRLELLMIRALGRSPTPPERDRLASAFHEFESRSATTEARRLAGSLLEEIPGLAPAQAFAWVAIARVVLNLDEFVTRE